jgi:hypothetical protein
MYGSRNVGGTRPSAQHQQQLDNAAHAAADRAAMRPRRSGRGLSTAALMVAAPPANRRANCSGRHRGAVTPEPSPVHEYVGRALLARCAQGLSAEIEDQETLHRFAVLMAAVGTLRSPDIDGGIDDIDGEKPNVRRGVRGYGELPNPVSRNSHLCSRQRCADDATANPADKQRHLQPRGGRHGSCG